MKRKPFNVTLRVLCIVVACILGIAVYYNQKADSLGSVIGQRTGSLVGKALGSIEGMTKGRKDGTEAGKEAGLSAEDTEASIAEEIVKLNNLEVLVASVKITDFHSIGEKEKYAALYLLKGNVVFSVDLSKAKITLNNNDEIQIEVPLPEGELYIDQSQVEKVAEYQRTRFSGSAEDGFDAYLNSMKKIREASTETLVNYEELLTSAKDSAEKQIRQLAMSVGVNKRKVNIYFMEE